jgi:hypothetical protein
VFGTRASDSLVSNVCQALIVFEQHPLPGEVPATLEQGGYVVDYKGFEIKYIITGLPRLDGQVENKTGTRVKAGYEVPLQLEFHEVGGFGDAAGDEEPDDPHARE